jgi:hypothetical protein
MRTLIRALLTMIIATVAMTVAAPAHATQSPSITRQACVADRADRIIAHTVSGDGDSYGNAYRLVRITPKRWAITKWSNAGTACRAIAHGSPRAMRGAWLVKIVYADVPLCEYEDGSGQARGAVCLWDATVLGNGVGRSYLVTWDDRTTYLT